MRPQTGIGIAVAALAAIAVGAGCAPGRHFEALRLLEDIAAGQTGDRAEDAPVRRAAASFVHADAWLPADIYHDGSCRGAPLVLVPGVTPQGRDDVHLVAFAEALARARFVVLVPEIANLRRLQVSAADAEPIASAVRALAGEVADAPEPAVGLAAVSYAVGPAILAALEPEVGAQLRYLVTIGGYHDLVAVITFFTTGYARDAEGAWRRGRPNPYGKWVFLQSNAARVGDEGDRRLLEAMARRKLDNPSAPIGDLRARLGPEGRAVDDLVTNIDPDAVPDLVGRLPPEIRAEIAALDLARRDLGGLTPRLYLIHGRDDPVIPADQSRALAGAVGEDKTKLAIAESLGHVKLGPGGIDDALTLWRLADDVLEERDAAAKVGPEMPGPFLSVDGCPPPSRLAA